MQNTSTLSPTFYKGIPFWEKQDSFRKTPETNNGIPITVRAIHPLVNPTRIQIPETLAQDNPIKTRILEIQTLETPVLEKREFILGCLPAHLRHKRWRRIFRWSAIKTKVTVTTVINRRIRNEGILLTNKEIMGITEDHGISMTKRSGIITLLPGQRILR